jgi:endonuclease/exonuclease/phosphatase family metal-dependent hydrolase
VRRGAFALLVVAVLFGVALTGCESDSSGSGGTSGGGKPAAVTVVAQNLLHGIACPSDSDRCRLPARVQLFGRQLEAAKCPQVVAIEEVDPVMRDLLREQAKTICSGDYEVVTDDDPSIDRELVLTTLPVVGQKRVRLAGPLRTALWVRFRSPVGPLDVVATHLASGSDDRPCDRSTCPSICRAEDTLNTCQGRQAAELLEERALPASVGVLMGDLNARPRDPTMKAILARDFVDTFVAAGNAECDGATGAGCTGGREDAELTDLTNPAARQQERIDYVLLHTRRDCDVVKPTGLFAAAPESPPLDGLVFASDHTGVTATIRCDTTTADLDAAKKVAGSSSTTTTRAAEVDAATAAAITTAYETVFNGGGEIETRLGALQDSEQLRDAFIARFEDPAVKAVVDGIRVRIDSLTRVDDTHVDVVYSILLDQAAVLDHVPGAAVREGDRWLVSKAAFCQVATLGQTTVPEPCR